MAFDRKRVMRSKAQTDLRRLGQQYDTQAAAETDPDVAAELRKLADSMRAQADALKPLPTEPEPG